MISTVRGDVTQIFCDGHRRSRNCVSSSWIWPTSCILFFILHIYYLHNRHVQSMNFAGIFGIALHGKVMYGALWYCNVWHFEYDMAWYCIVWLGDRSFGLDFGICGHWSPPVLWNALFIATNHSLHQRIYILHNIRPHRTIPYHTISHHSRSTQWCHTAAYHTIVFNAAVPALKPQWTHWAKLHCNKM